MVKEQHLLIAHFLHGTNDRDQALLIEQHRHSHKSFKFVQEAIANLYAYLLFLILRKDFSISLNYFSTIEFFQHFSVKAICPLQYNYFHEVIFCICQTQHLETFSQLTIYLTLSYSSHQWLTKEFARKFLIAYASQKQFQFGLINTAFVRIKRQGDFGMNDSFPKDVYSYFNKYCCGHYKMSLEVESEMACLLILWKGCYHQEISVFYYDYSQVCVKVLMEVFVEMYLLYFRFQFDKFYSVASQLYYQSNMDDDWLIETDQNTGEKIIAEREHLNQIESHYSIGYQGALVGHLEQRQEKTALETIQNIVKRDLKELVSKYTPVAEAQIMKFLSQSKQQ